MINELAIAYYDQKVLTAKNSGVWFFLGFGVFAFFVYAAYCSSRGMRFSGSMTWNRGLWIECV